MRFPEKRAGFSLIETLFALVLLTVVVVPLLNMWYTSAAGNQRSREETVALNLARARLEECVAAGYEGVDALPGANLGWLDCPGWPGFSSSLTVEIYDALLGVKQVTVRMRTPSLSGEVVLAGLLARGE